MTHEPANRPSGLSPSDTVQTSSGFDVVFGVIILIVGLIFLFLTSFLAFALTDTQVKSVLDLSFIVAILSACAYLSIRAGLKLLTTSKELPKRVFSTADMYIAGAMFLTTPVLMVLSLIRGMPLNAVEIYSVIFSPVFAYWCFKLAKHHKEKARS
ncbi:MAG TPA: hypothetical protein VGV16_05345 [Gammaproteobacteria bacterium]|nr:hypothetical protein [Gammaproteobacteria bacterium]